MRRAFATTLFGLLLICVSPVHASTTTLIVAGTDYLTTMPGTTFDGVSFIGVPVGPGNTDTIVQRLMGINVTSGIGTTPLLMTQLQMETAAPANFGLGTGFYFFTLQSARGGPATTGSMTAVLTAPDDHSPNTPEGTFSSFFDVFFDIHLGSLNGPIAESSDLTVTTTGGLWDADPAPGEVIVPGLVGDLNADLHTNKVQTSDVYQMDFFPVGSFVQFVPGGAFTHVVTGATVPEPGSGLLVALGGLGLLALRLRR